MRAASLAKMRHISGRSGNGGTTASVQWVASTVLNKSSDGRSGRSSWSAHPNVWVASAVVSLCTMSVAINTSS